MDASTTPLSGHMAIAGAVNGAAVFGQSLAGPFLAPFVELGSAAITASVAAHAVHRVARETQQPTYRILGPIARSAQRTRGNVLAAHALDVACRASLRDRRAFGLGVQLLGRCVSGHVKSAFGHLLSAWCPPLGGVGAVVVASKAAARGVHFVKTVEDAAAAAVRETRGHTRVDVAPDIACAVTMLASKSNERIALAEPARMEAAA